MLDIFRNDAFSVLSMTDRINKVPFIPGRAGQLIDWNEEGISSLYVAIEEETTGVLIINPSPRGSPGDTVKKDPNKMRVVRVPHYEIDDAVNADEVQGVREFGTENQLRTVQGVVDKRMDQHVKLRLNPTLEYQRVGAIRGRIINGDGSVLLDLHAAFDTSAQASFAITFSPTASDGSVRTKSAAAKRVILNALGGIPYTGLHAFAGDNFYDALIAAKETRETFLGQQKADELRATSGAYEMFFYAGIWWENYQGGVGNVPFIDTNEAIIFPIGVPGLFRTVFAPADYVETVNTIGLPRYAKQFPQPNEKGINMEVQMNALSYCTRPNVIQRVTKA